jgi:UDP-N-acetylmuramoyl-L-alanyl-D-glutamate--2,6-diaminopimelate ligase
MAQADAADIEIAGITADSRRVLPGFLFAALPGARADGRAFIAEAVSRGAAAVLAPSGTAWPDGVARRMLIEDADPRRLLALLAARFAGPQPRHLVAVTGTNGKTSTVEFLRQIWMLGAHHAASLGTLGLIVDEGCPHPDPLPQAGEGDHNPQNPQSRKKPSPARGRGLDEGAGAAPTASLTTPDPVALAETLAALARAGVDHAAMEASSHGLDQSRLDGVALAAAGFTNLTRDHLDYHGSEAAYRDAKLRLFADLLPAGAPALANSEMDATTLEALADITKRRRLDFGTVGETGTVLRLLRATPLPAGQTLEILADGARHEIALPLPGRFQADNALLAAALATSLGETGALSRLPRLTGVRGRMELAATLPNGAAAYVDYAHTPDALERLLTALRPHTTGRLIVVFGAGGDRDRGKRPLMGAVAARLADAVIVTDDNPRTEDPAAIRAAVAAACPDAAVIADRAEAIAAGLSDLRPGDVLAVAGKGHEQGQTIGTAVIPFDDVATIRRLAGMP